MELRDYQIRYALNEGWDDTNPQERVIYQLIDSIANDSNSSMYREDITNIMSNREPSKGKHGYDHDSEPIEIKPKNFTGGKKLDGGGQFNDFTWRRHNKHIDDNVLMSVSGFHYGKLIFIVEFPYSELTERLESQLSRLLPNGDVTNIYVRSCNFSYLNWKDSDFNLVWISENLDDYKDSMVKGLYNTLKSKQTENTLKLFFKV